MLKLSAYDFIVMIFVGGGHKLFYKNPVWCGNTKSVTHPMCVTYFVTPQLPTQKSTQPPCQTGFLVTAGTQGPHSPAGLQGVKTSLWSPLKTTELSQYCVGISCLKLLTPGQGTEVWGDSEVNQGTSPEDCSLQLQLQQLLQLQHLEGQPTWWGGADYYYSTLFNLILYSVLKIWLLND